MLFLNPISVGSNNFLSPVGIVGITKLSQQILQGIYIFLKVGVAASLIILICGLIRILLVPFLRNGWKIRSANFQQPEDNEWDEGSSSLIKTYLINKYGGYN